MFNKMVDYTVYLTRNLSFLTIVRDLIYSRIYQNGSLTPLSPKSYIRYNTNH